MKNLLYVGLDVHKDSISIAVAEPSRDGEIRSYAKITNRLRTRCELANAVLKKGGVFVVLDTAGCP